MQRRLATFAIVLVFAVCGLAQANKNVKITHGPVVESAKNTDATIAWSTNSNASTILKYGTSPTNLNMTAEAPWGGTTHRVHLKGLNPGTTYFYRVESTQAQGTGTQIISGVQQFQTQGGVTAGAAAAQPNYTPAELENFDNFLDSHPQIRAELTSQPTLANDPNYVAQHPPLAQFLQSHPNVAAALRTHPGYFVRSEGAYAATEDRNTALHNFQQYLAAHPKENSDLMANPALANDPNYLRSHPDLAQFLQAHQGVKANMQSSPDSFMQAEAELPR
jgi:hypothetical protein